MNLFVLDTDPDVAAFYHCDKHVLKMIIETGQLLCTAHWVLWLKHLGKNRDDFRLLRDVNDFLLQNIPVDEQPPWKMTHINHPCAIWVRETVSNYSWALRLMKALLLQYKIRYKKAHKSQAVYRWLHQNIPPGIKDESLTDFPICMPEDCKVNEDPVLSYQKYYLEKKSYMAKWKTGKVPPWWRD